MRSTSLLAALPLCLAAAVAPLAQAAWQPDGKVEIVVAGGPGGGTDQLGRLISTLR